MKRDYGPPMWLSLLSSCFMIAVVGFCIYDEVHATQRTGDPKQTVVIEPAIGDFDQIDESWLVPVDPVSEGGIRIDVETLSWAAQAVPVDPFAVASPQRTELAGTIFGNLLSDPSWRAQYDALFRSYMSWGHPREVAAAMADAMAAERVVSFADALLAAAGE